jgi:hypothetical protein
MDSITRLNVVINIAVENIMTPSGSILPFPELVRENGEMRGERKCREGTRKETIHKINGKSIKIKSNKFTQPKKSH